MQDLKGSTGNLLKKGTPLLCILDEHPYLGIGLSFVGFALARYEGGVHGDTFSIEAQKHETVDGSASA